MAALATIQNPIVTGPTQECLLFYLTSTSQVAQQQRVPGDKDPQNTPILPQGNIMNPSSFTVLLDKNLIRLYGIVESPDPKSKTASIWQVSPTLIPLDGTTTTYGSLAGTGTGTDGYLYYLADDPSGRPRVNEYDILNESTNLLSDLSNNTPTTYLASYTTDTEADRFVIYQGEDALHCFSIADSSDFSIPHTDNAMNITPIAATAVQSTPCAVYVYYCNQHNELQSVVLKNGQWTLRTLKQTPKLNQATQISVTPDLAASCNRVFYEGVDKLFVNYTDKW